MNVSGAIFFPLGPKRQRSQKKNNAWSQVIEVVAPKTCTQSPAVSSGVARILKRLTNQHFYDKKPTILNLTYLKQHFGEEETCPDESNWLILMKKKKKKENTRQIHFGFSRSLWYQQTKTFCDIRSFLFSSYKVLRKPFVETGCRLRRWRTHVIFMLKLT